uniref:Uncharacterized protein n=1 Tax=Romanomermis culicivorax TaxID=13658 RepID=A0A915HLJ8_ROMCU
MPIRRRVHPEDPYNKGSILYDQIEFEGKNLTSANVSSCGLEFYNDSLHRFSRLQNLMTNVSAFLIRKSLLYYHFYDPILTNGSIVDRPVFFVDDSNFRKMLSKIHGPEGLSWLKNGSTNATLIVTRKRQILKYGSAILMIIALVCIVCGALWAGHAHSEEKRQFLEDEKLMESVRNRVKTGRIDVSSDNQHQKSRPAASSAVTNEDDETSTSPNSRPRIAMLSSIAKV